MAKTAYKLCRTGLAARKKLFEHNPEAVFSPLPLYCLLKGSLPEWFFWFIVQKTQKGFDC